MKTELRIMKLEDAKNEDVFNMLQEIPKVDNGFENSVYGLTREQFGDWVRRTVEWSMGVGLPEGLVRETYCWFYVDDQLAGLGKIRHNLTERLRMHGGNIGYALRPSARGKGLGKIWLALLMDQARKFGIEDLLVTCIPSNIASRKIIEANGGVLESGDEETSRFWIRRSDVDTN
jgi:predicted acetyltransferase